MPEDIIDFEPLTPEPASPEAGAPAAKAEPASSLTREELAEFGQNLSRQILAGIHQGAPRQAETQPDWEQRFTDQAVNAATARLMETNKPLFAASIAEQVAGHYGPDVKREIVETLQKLPGHVVANLPHSPDDMKKLGHLARGIHAEKQAAQAPRSSAAGTVGGSTVAENELATKFWNDYKDVPGFTKDMAREMAKDSLAEK